MSIFKIGIIVILVGYFFFNQYFKTSCNLLSDSMMKAEVADYEIGKRHLANIMGENPETFTQDDVNVR